MTASGMSALVRWTCSATGRILSSANRWKVSADELELLGEVARARCPTRATWPASCCEERGGAVGLDERERGRERFAVDAPRRVRAR